MKILKYRTKKAGRYNEDSLVLSKNTVGVIDGATGLEPSGEEKRSTASLLSSFLKKHLEHYSGGGIKKYLYSLGKLSFKAGYQNATCGVSLVIDEGDKLCFTALGDCDIFYRLKSGEIKHFGQRKLKRLDSIAIDEMTHLAREKGISVREARPLINETLIRHRKMVNTKEGYYAFQPQEEPCFVPKCMRLRKEDVDVVIICSDGFSQCFDTLDIVDSYKDLFAENADLDRIIREIVRVSCLDSEFNKYPRFKPIDDISYVEIKP